MRLLEKTDTARDRKRNLLPRQFQLQFQRVKMRAIQNGDVIQTHAFIAQLQRALRDERRLLPGIVARDERGFHAGFSRG